MNERKELARAFLDGCRVAVVGHVGTWLVIKSVEQVWHVAGHVFVGITLYILDRLLHF